MQLEKEQAGQNPQSGYPGSSLFQKVGLFHRMSDKTRRFSEPQYSQPKYGETDTFSCHPEYLITACASIWALSSGTQKEGEAEPGAQETSVGHHKSELGLGILIS